MKILLIQPPVEDFYQTSIRTLIDSIVHLMERPVLIGPSVFYATPSTESYRQCEAAGLLTSSELALQRSSCFQ